MTHYRQKEVEQARTLAARSQNLSSRLETAVVDARIRAVRGDSAGAETILKSALAEAGKSGHVKYQFESRLAMGEIETKSSNAAGRVRLAALGKDATAKGFTLIAQKAARAMS